jgi:hypothetical protein
MSGESVAGSSQPASGAAFDPFGAVRWDRTGAIGEFTADTTLDSALRRVRKHRLAWVVVTVPAGTTLIDPLHYVIRASEVERIAATQPQRGSLSLDQALDLPRRRPAPAIRSGQPLAPVHRTSELILEMDAGGRVTAVGETTSVVRDLSAPKPPPAVSPAEVPREMSAPPEPATPAAPASPAAASAGTTDDPLGLGPTRGISRPRRGGTRAAAMNPPQPPAEAQPGGSTSPPDPPPGGVIEITVSAEAPAQLDLGKTGRVPFQIELAGEAMPLAEARNASARQDLPIVVSLSVENDALAIVRTHEATVDPPASGEPRTGFFAVKAVRAGTCRLAIAFRQGGSDLAVIALAVEVVASGASADTAKSKAAAEPRDATDDDKLALLVEQRVDGNQVFYEYTLHSEALGLPYKRVRSKPLLDAGGGPAATAIAFVERIYQRVTRELKSLNDLKELQREARALGASLCEELFDPDVARLLWPLRDRLRVVQIVSWEPYIPWEIVRLRDPATGDIDERFLCEYGLVRTLSDEMPARTLPLGRWTYLGADFPLGSFPPVGAELDYFTASTPQTLRSRGIEPKALAPNRDAFFEALSAGDFDVLHIACHAESQHESIEQASLILADESRPGEARPALVEVDTVTVAAEARLRERRPLVFLNACETGRAGAVLTAWGGWPNVFLRKGAGAFVGTAWPVRDKPAAAFSTTFYNALMDGGTLAEAASAARTAAQKFGDASWLAFKVYGHPRARRTAAP